ncbi:Uncharacterized protein SCF082_LOCUS7619 [Durusdinium trenchii]|uniref:Uncharacterized protein n=1 Tax=Durusdinium trenchii TaxID=1381693 RepID=A0ABP0IPA4_9DINO
MALTVPVPGPSGRRGVKVGRQFSSPSLNVILKTLNPLQIPEIIGAAGTSASEDSSSVGDPEKELRTELEPHLLRAVPLHVALGRCGTHWYSAERGGMGEIDPKLYQLSRPTCTLDSFLSHDWHTSGLLKVLSLLIIFNSRPTFVATFLVSVAVGLMTVHLKWDMGFFLTMPGNLVYLLMLGFWPHLRRLVLGPVMVFMDKLCIAQHDEELKEAGILGLAAFLKNSKRLTILWSPLYFKRLWCSFEVATFLNHGEGKRIEIMPVKMSLLLMLLAVHLKIQNTLLTLELGEQLFSDESHTFQRMAVLAMEGVLMLPMILYVGIGLMKEVDALPDQLQTFDVRKTECFCCSNNHQHPATDVELSCDRRVVYKTLQEWYGLVEPSSSHLEMLSPGSLASSKGSPTSRSGSTGFQRRAFLDAFNHSVRVDLASRVMRSIGGGWYMKYAMTLSYGLMLPYISLWIVEIAAGPEQKDLSHEELSRWVVRRCVYLASQPVLAVLTLWLYLAMCKTGVILTDGCSQLVVALILLVPLLLVEFLFKMPMEFFMHITDETSLIPLIPFCFSSTLAVILWRMTFWSVAPELLQRERSKTLSRMSSLFRTESAPDSVETAHDGERTSDHEVDEVDAVHVAVRRSLSSDSRASDSTVEL